MEHDAAPGTPSENTPPARLEGGFDGTSTDLDRPDHHHHLTKSRAARKLTARAVVKAMPTVPPAMFPARGVEVVYFAESAGLVKVSTTENLKSRMRAIASGVSSPVRVVAFGLGGFSREQHLHGLLRADHHHGEWFKPSTDLIEWMRHASTDSWIWRELPPTLHQVEGPMTRAQHDDHRAWRERFENSPMMLRPRAERNVAEVAS